MKASKITEPIQKRLVHVTAGFYLLFARSHHYGVLDARFVQPMHAVQIAGIALTSAGVALAIWARLILGANWSGRVTRKVDHQLIRTGPYAYVRHPIYTGLLLATAGTALFIGEWRCLIALVWVLAGETFKAKREEQFMLAEFGESYRQYQQQTGFLIPGV